MHVPTTTAYQNDREGHGIAIQNSKPLYIASPANREGKDTGLYILDEAAFMSNLDGRLCPSIQGVDHENQPSIPQNPD